MDAESAFCIQCGARLGDDETFCPKCGAQVAEKDHIYSGSADPQGYIYGTVSAEKSKAESKITTILILTGLFMVVAAFMAVICFSFGSLISMFESNPELLNGTGLTVEDMKGYVGMMNIAGAVFVASMVLLGLGMFFAYKKEKFTLAVMSYAVGSAVLFGTFVAAGVMSVVFAAVGFLVTYLLYKSKPAFKN